MPATLAERFQAEVRRSPQKAAVLAVLVAVALWYWAPLLTKLTSGKSGSDKQPTATELTATVVPPAIQPLTVDSPAPTAATAAPARPSWEGVLEQIDGDARMRSAPALPVVRDPFRPVAVAAAPAEMESSKQAAGDNQPPAEEEPAPALERKPVTLPLTAIILGRARRTALIGGRVYQQGDICPAFDMEFRIVSIDRDRIVLERLSDGFRFEQSVPRQELSPHLEIRRGQ